MLYTYHCIACGVRSQNHSILNMLDVLFGEYKLIFTSENWTQKYCLLHVRKSHMTHSYVWHDPFIWTWLVCIRHNSCMISNFPTKNMCFHTSVVTWRAHLCDITHSRVWRGLSMCVTRRIHMCDTTHSHLWRDSSMCATWLIHMCDLTHSYVWHDSLICATWLIHVYDVARPYAWHDAFMCDMTHSCVWHDSSICMTRRIYMSDSTHSRVWRDSSICATWLIHMCDMTLSRV